ncbi:ATP-binding protein [Pseudomonas syringae]|uniref:ATP-binding protein n=1 Tax=Pseudomonas syringae TaxID=317 RepID=UPI0034D544E5
MINSVAFQTRARTIDHLGREQIADCPTAISELWKNSYDAYARIVGLHIYDGEYAIATIVDDGHGMSGSEFRNKWLVVGTESKRIDSGMTDSERLGLAPRVKQGQKGIGRLSSANLGSLLLIVSKRKDERFVASLIDWRLFENPYLYLMDIEIPVVEFDSKDELFPLLPDMFDALLKNVFITSPLSERDLRVNSAWTQFNNVEESEGKKILTQQSIQNTVIGTLIKDWHFSEWPLWCGDSDHGTILIISNVQPDLLAQLPRFDGGAHGNDSTVIQSRDQLFQTLSNIADPFLSDKELRKGEGVSNFSTKATARDSNRLKVIIDDQPPFDLAWLHELEHVVDGVFDEEGVFKGRIKAFGAWLDDEIIITPAIDIPSRKDSFVGGFNLRLGTYEQRLDATSHSEETYRNFEAKSELYSGFMIYRNALRVMPYGREGSDFFQIEKRRTLNAGREFWSLRRLFGRVSLSKKDNPNLRDKAGREGLIDNKSAKVFRDLVINVLRVTARSYFGSSSVLRENIMPDRLASFKKQKLDEARNKQKLKNRKAFSAKLKKNDPILSDVFFRISELLECAADSDFKQEELVLDYRERSSSFKNELKELVILDAPRNLGLLDETYSSYKSKLRKTKEMLDLLDNKVAFALDLIKPKSSRDIVYAELNANATFLSKRIKNWAGECRAILSSELGRLQKLQGEREYAYRNKTLSYLADAESGSMSIGEISQILQEERDIQDAENASLFESYAAVLSSLQDSIDLAGLANHSDDIAEGLREEVDRLHGLAQLGITVEIIGHEIESLEYSVSNSLKLFPADIQSSSAYQEVKTGHDALIDRLRFLSPLKLSGPKARVKITGAMIFEYVHRFFRGKLEEQGVEFLATPGFKRFSIYDQPARIYPVFINLVNNSAYWVEHSSESVKKIILDVFEGKVVVSDNGPGVDVDDLNRLFQLFFTKKVRGGRGVGLYLCRANLAASGHTIFYVDSSGSLLSGANFVIDFKGGKYE